MLFSRSADIPPPDWLTTTPIAHRGLHRQGTKAAENSMTAFRLAMEAGLAIELDVHLSADQIPVVFHDDTLLRMTGDVRQVSDVSAKDLTSLVLEGKTDTIPTLQTVLEEVQGKVPLIIELKRSSFGPASLGLKVWEILKSYTGPYAIQSFDPMILKWFRLNAPNVIRGQLAMKSPPRKMPVHRKFMIRHMLFNHISKPHYIGYDVNNINSWAVRRAMKKNMRLLAWTVKTQSQLGQARRYADNIIFEDLSIEQLQ